MATLSLAMIVKNEQRTLGRILACAQAICDELVVVDTGSTDGTQDIARAAGAKLYDFTWIDDFAAARNFAFAQCTQDWIVWLDADDFLTQASLDAVLRYKQTLFDEARYDAFYTDYHYDFSPTGAVSVILHRERFLRRSANFTWHGRIHEIISTYGHASLPLADVIIEHRPHEADLPRKEGRNLRNYESWIDVDTASLRDIFLYGCELLWNRRAADAIPVFETYLARAEKPDTFGEYYMTHIKLADSLIVRGRNDEATQVCLRAIAMEPSRAEGYCLLAINYVNQRQWERAWPLLLAATGCRQPSCNLVVNKFYDETPRQLMVRCLQHTRDTGLVKRIINLPPQLAQMLAACGAQQQQA